MPVDDAASDRATAAAVEVDFAELYHREFGRIAGVVRSLVGRRDVAEEITQDAFVVTHDRWAKVGTYDRPQDFVRRVALNRAVSSLRRRGAEHRALGRVAGRRDEPMTGEADADEAPVWQHVRLLPARQRQVIALVYVEDLAVERVAEILGISESSVKTHLRRARAALAGALGNERSISDEREEGDR